MEADVLDLLHAAIGAERDADPALEACGNGDAAVARAAAPRIGESTGLDQLAVLFQIIACRVGGLAVVDEQLKCDVGVCLGCIRPEHEHLAARPVVAEGIVRVHVQREHVRPRIAAVLTDLQCAAAVPALAVCTEKLHIAVDELRIGGVVRTGPCLLEQVVRKIFHVPRGLVGSRGAVTGRILLRDGDAVRAGRVVGQGEGIEVEGLALGGVVVAVTRVDLDGFRRNRLTHKGAEGDADPADVTRRNGDTRIVCAVPRTLQLARKLCFAAGLRGVVGFVDHEGAAVNLEIHVDVAGECGGVRPQPEHLAARPVGDGGRVAVEHQGKDVCPAIVAVLRDGQGA